MLKKAKAEIETGDTGTAKDLSQGVLDSSHKIWLAGLGAFSRVQEEGGKVFETLVKQEMAGGTWDKLEKVFEDRVARALSKLGVYTQNDVQRLAARVDDLAEAVNKLVKTSGGKPVAPLKVATKKKGAAVSARKSAKPHRKAASK